MHPRSRTLMKEAEDGLSHSGERIGPMGSLLPVRPCMTASLPSLIMIGSANGLCYGSYRLSLFAEEAGAQSNTSRAWSLRLRYILHRDRECVRCICTLRIGTIMSGVETIVGLTLGVLPLLISAAEHYDDCLRPFIRYNKFAKEAGRFRDLLGIQKTIFRNQCRILLEEIIEHDVATTMLNGPSGANHPSWSNIDLEKELCKLLGDSRAACVTTIELIEERLRDIDCESRDLETTIDQDSQVSFTAECLRGLADRNNATGQQRPRWKQTLEETYR